MIASYLMPYVEAAVIGAGLVGLKTVSTPLAPSLKSVKDRDLFALGAVFHLVAEVSGANRWYCQNTERFKKEGPVTSKFRAEATPYISPPMRGGKTGVIPAGWGGSRPTGGMVVSQKEIDDFVERETRQAIADGRTPPPKEELIETAKMLLVKIA
jgi:hypothetical protein